MALVRFDPFRELDRLSERMWGLAGLHAMGGGFAAMDAYRHGDEVVASFDLPGVDPASIDLEVDQNVLTVKAERHRELPEGSEVICSERSEGTVTRQVYLGDTLDIEHISARYDDGVLSVTIPVAEEARPRKVEIASARPAAELAGATATS